MTLKPQGHKNLGFSLMKFTMWPTQQHPTTFLSQRNTAEFGKGEEEYGRKEKQAEIAFSAPSAEFIALHGAEKVCYFRHDMLNF